MFSLFQLQNDSNIITITVKNNNLNSFFTYLRVMSCLLLSKNFEYSKVFLDSILQFWLFLRFLPDHLVFKAVLCIIISVCV